MQYSIKTVAILTFHSAKSYGAVLQAYALCKFLQLKGFNVFIINLRPPSITGAITLNPISWIESRRFGQFEREYFSYSPHRYATIEDLKANPPMADYYIVGSDQVWNEEITGDYQFSYFLDFVPDGKKLISYAASFGKEELTIDSKNKTLIENLLRRFHAISIREKSGIKIAKDNFNIEATQVLDPTLLLSDFSSFCAHVKNKKHVVAVKFNKDKQFYQILREIGVFLEIPITLLDSSHPRKGLKIIPKPSVITWLQTINSATLVVTDSFHGIAFCIIFQKDFIAIPANLSRFTRIENLLKSLNLTDRIFYSYDEIRKDMRWKKKINYQAVMCKLNKLRGDSANFLCQALNS